MSVVNTEDPTELMVDVNHQFLVRLPPTDATPIDDWSQQRLDYECTRRLDKALAQLGEWSICYDHHRLVKLSVPPAEKILGNVRILGESAARRRISRQNSLQELAEACEYADNELAQHFAELGWSVISSKPRVFIPQQKHLPWWLDMHMRQCSTLEVIRDDPPF